MQMYAQIHPNGGAGVVYVANTVLHVQSVLWTAIDFLTIV